VTAIRVSAVERVVRIVARGGSGVAAVNVAAPLTTTGGSTPTIGIAPATGTTPGSLSAADKAKLDALADPTLSSSAPQQLGVAFAGVSTQAARGDHVHAHGAQAGGGLHATATPLANGFMSASQASKLEGIAAGAQVNVPTNLGVGGGGDARTLTSSTGASAALPLATPATAGLLSTFYATLLANFAGNVRDQILATLAAGSNVTLASAGSGASRTITISATGSGGGGSDGTVTSVQASGGSTGLTFTGGPITGAGTLTLGGTLAIASGGTGATTASAARAALGAGTGNGTVTSVGLSLPGIFSVSGSPVTAAGTLSASLASQTLGLVWASPADSDGAPVFRALVQSDIPQLSASKIVLSANTLAGQTDGSAATPITLGTGLSFSSTTLTLSTNLQGWHALAPSSKQDALTAGPGIDITAGVISATGGGASAAEDVTYDNATSGLAATDVQAAIDEVLGIFTGSAGGDWLGSVEGWAWGGTSPNWRDLVGSNRVDVGQESSSSTGSFVISGRALSSADANAAFFETSAATVAATLNRGVGYGSIRTIGFVRRADLYPELQGFRIRMRFGFGDAGLPLKSDSRIFCGLYDNTGTPTQTVRIDSFLNLFGIGKDDDQSGLQLIHAADVGTYTSTPLGITTASVSGVPLSLYIESGSDYTLGMSYSLTRIDTGAVLASGTVTTNLPINNIQLRPVIYINSGNISNGQCRLFLGGWNWVCRQPGA
jgi:hypothetical protein